MSKYPTLKLSLGDLSINIIPEKFEIRGAGWRDGAYVNNLRAMADIDMRLIAVDYEAVVKLRRLWDEHQQLVDRMTQLPKFETESWRQIKGRGLVAVCKWPDDDIHVRDILDRDVCIDGTQFHVRGVESFGGRPSMSLVGLLVESGGKKLCPDCDGTKNYKGSVTPHCSTCDCKGWIEA